MTCNVCDLPGSRCDNYWCARGDRGFDTVWAIGAHRGTLKRAIVGLKYRGEVTRAAWLGRLLAAYLIERAPCFEDVDLIVPMTGAHTEAVLRAAGPYLRGLWPIAPLVAKATPTRTMVSLPSATARRLWAAGDLRPALRVTDPRRVAGRRVLVVDDVFTDGSTLREVAGVLRYAGAAAVEGLVLARAPRLPATQNSDKVRVRDPGWYP